MGAYKKQQAVDWSRVNRLVFICHGNICRSSLADCSATSYGVNTASCGLSCGRSFPADPRAVEYAKSIGLDLSRHKTTKIEDVEFSDNDLLVVMEPAHLLGLESHDLKNSQTTMAGLWSPKKYAYLHDPFSASEEFFSISSKRVVDSVRGIVEQIK